MTELTDLQAQLVRLRKARSSGLRSVQHGDTRTEYKSDAEMAAAIAALEQQISGLEGTTRRRVRYIYESSKGL